MAEEQTKPTTTEPLTKEDKKAGAVKTIIETITKVMKAALSKGDADTKWYKKGLYYTAAVIAAALVYAFSTYGIEIIDWATALVQGLF